MGPIVVLCLLAAIVVSTANPIIYEEVPVEYVMEELPEDSGISKRSLQREVESPLMGNERITRSLRTDFGTPLTGMEKITKRSLKTEDGFPLTGVEKISKRSADEEETRIKRQIFLPAFARRNKRSVKYETDVLDSNDVFKREKRQLFLPGFARRRSGRSIPDEDNMETAETIFLPGFARRG